MVPTGWKEGQPLPGSRDLPNDERLQLLFTDGLLLASSFLHLGLLLNDSLQDCI